MGRFSEVILFKEKTGKQDYFYNHVVLANVVNVRILYRSFGETVQLI